MTVINERARKAWKAFAAFQVFGDHVPMGGFQLVVRLSPDPSVMVRLVESRAAQSESLDPELGQHMMRAGLGLLGNASVSLVYANPEEAICVLRAAAVQDVGESLPLHDHLVSGYASRLARLTGCEVPVSGEVYEFPDAAVVRRAIVSAQESLEESTPMRCSNRIGAQMRGRGQPFHPSMVETLEEQTSLLESNGIDMESLPSWWWRGIAARRGDGSPDSLQVFEDLPPADQFLALIA